MIQFNLLPDVKLEFVKAQRVKHTVISAAIITTGSAFAIFLLLFLAVHVAQRKSIADLTTDIKTYSKELKETPDLNKILTIQNQLGSLTDLHAGKPTVSRTFVYIQQLIPPNIALTDVTIDYVANTISISGQTTGLDVVNKLVDTLKYTNTQEGDTTGKKAFSDVVMVQFSRTFDAAQFTVTAKYTPEIFDNTKNVGLKVPNQISSSSVIGQPTNLFKKVEQP